jgi:hypothetical protein
MTPELPSNHWQLLGLDPATATERGVKSSYAKLLKRYKPDQFPQEFQQVRTAYESALWELQNAVEPAELEESSLEPDAKPNDDFQQTIDQLGEALHQPENVPQQRQLFQKLFHEFPKIENGPERWLSMLDSLFEAETKALSQLVRPAQLLALLELEDVSTFCAVVMAWKAMLDMEKLNAASQVILQAGSQPQSPATAVAICRFANLLAVHNPAMANRLLNKCFPLLPTSQRPRLSATVEARIGIGKLLHGVPPQHQAFWEERLCEPDRTVDWSAERAQKALHHLQANFGHSWQGYSILRPILPPQELQRLEKASEIMQRFQPKPLLRPRFRSLLLRWGGLAFGLAMLLRGCAPMLEKFLFP